MVFFIVACHLPDHEEAQIEQVLNNNCIGSGPRSNGELYPITVSFQIKVA